MIPNPHQHGMTRLRRVPSACPLTIRFRVRLGAGTPLFALLGPCSEAFRVTMWG